MKDFSLARAGHCIGEANFHVQLTAAYRRPIFAIPAVQRLTKAYILAKAESLGIAIPCIGFGPDHLHFFAANCRKYSIREVVRLTKGFTSYMMRKNHRKLFEHLLWGKKFWTSGYFYRSVGSVTKEAMAYYIEHAQRKHWDVVDEEFYRFEKEQMSLEQYAG